MDIKRLQQFITLSNEDFADAHEPVNDGVKEVPDADDIAKMVTRSGGSGESDLTTQGEGKVIPEKPDTDEVVEKKEETTTTETTEETETPAKAPPFEKKEPEETSEENSTDLKETDDTDIEKDSEEEFNKINDTVNTLKHSQIAVEQYIELLRGNKRISKQAAAIIQVGLEHIDTTCGLKVRNFGLESYDTTPKSAMESADVNEKTLLGRAAEIGAKIMEWLNTLFTRFEAWSERLLAGITVLNNEVDLVIKEVEKLPNDTVFKPVSFGVSNSKLFIGSEFVAEHISKNEKEVLNKMNKSIHHTANEIVRPVITILTRQPNDSEATEEINEFLSKFKNNEEEEDRIQLPGGAEFFYNRGDFQIRISLISDGPTPSGPGEIDFSSKAEYIKSLKELRSYAETLNVGDTMVILRKARDQLKRSVLARRANMEDEVVFQKLQAAAIQETFGHFDMHSYISILKKLADFVRVRLLAFQHAISELGVK